MIMGLISRIGRIFRKIGKTFRRSEKFVPVYIPVLDTDLLNGRTALITGGGSGIGFAIAKAFSAAGASVIICGRDIKKLQDAATSIGGQTRIFGLDMTDTAAFASFVGKVGDFDILVNNAGYVGGGVFGSTQISEYDKVLDTNLKGAYFLSQEVSKLWIARGVRGNILNVCSASSLRPGESPYILSKWGLRSLTIGMARNLIKHGIVVNGIAPGCTNTEKFCAREREDINNHRNPTGRMVTVQEVANLAVIMASSLARMVVGDVLYVTGGGAITTLDD